MLAAGSEIWNLVQRRPAMLDERLFRNRFP